MVRPTPYRPAIWTLLCLAVILPGTAFAQTTINQARALAGRVTPSDAPGFPITISRPGSYKLTGNLDATIADVNEVIDITASDVTIDLNGFSVFQRGGTTAIGILSSADRTSVLNGAVQGFSWGLDLRLGSGHRVERIIASFNAKTGIVVGPNSLVTLCVSHHSDGIGLEAGEGTVIVANIFSVNDSIALLAAAGTVTSYNVFDNNFNSDAEFLAPSAGYGSNVFTSDFPGAVRGGTQLTLNLCRGRLCQ